MNKFIVSLSSIALLTLSGVSSHANTTPKGVYSGQFGDGKATLFIDSVSNGKVKGSSLYKHNKRPVTGTIKAQGNFWHITLNEPATQIGDGQFDMTANKDDPSILIGKWKVFSKTNTKAGIATKNFTLSKTSCTYNKYNGYHDASTRLLTDDDLYLDPYSLDYMRNEIYARHGYSFKSTEWASAFVDEKWYVPCYTDVSNKLTNIEKQNIKRIKQMRDYMEANPEMWGR